jgi:hypothetical protein
MSVACAAKVCKRFLWEGDTSNKPFEWTGRHQLTAPPPQSPCLPLKGSVRSILIGWVATKLDELPPQSKKYLDGHHRKMNPHHEGMVHLDYHGAQQ